MKQSRIMNLKNGLTTCLTCGQQRSWDIQVCPNPNCGKRVVMVQHVDSTQEVTPDFGQHLHQCGWCGEWYTGARVDHGCPAPEDQSAQQWSTNEAKAAQKAEGEVLAAALARDVTSDYIDYLETIYGAELHESPRDWQDMRGDCAV